MTPRSDPHTEAPELLAAIREWVETDLPNSLAEDPSGFMAGIASASVLDALDTVGTRLAALESEGDEALLRTERDALAESEALFARAVAAEARVTQLEKRDDWLAKQLDGCIHDAGLLEAVTNLATARALVSNLKDARQCLGVVADGGGGQ